MTAGAPGFGGFFFGAGIPPKGSDLPSAASLANAETNFWYGFTAQLSFSGNFFHAILNLPV